MHRGSDDKNKPKEYSITFEDDEYITGIKVYHLNIMNGIKFKTSKGKEYKFKSKIGRADSWSLPRN